MALDKGPSREYSPELVDELAAEQAEELDSPWGLGIDFERLLTELQVLRSREGLNKDDVCDQLDEIEKAGLIESVLKRVEFRINDECGTLGSYGYRDIAQKVARPSSYKGATKGEFHFHSGEIRMDKYLLMDLPDNRKMLFLLASLGFVFALEIFAHERIHSLQITPDGKDRSSGARKLSAIAASLVTGVLAMGGLYATLGSMDFSLLSIFLSASVALGSFRAGRKVGDIVFATKMKSVVVLDEAQTYLGSNLLYKDDDTRIGQYFRRIAKCPGVKASDTDKILEAILNVKRLYALGLSDEEIAKLVAESEWDKENVVYDQMTAKVQSLACEKDLEMEDVDNLVLKQDLKAAIYTEKVKMIAQEEIQRAAAN